MLDLKFIRENPDKVRRGLVLKQQQADVDGILELDTQRRALTTRGDELKKERNDLSAQVGKLIRSGGDAEPVKQRVRDLGDEIRSIDEQLATIDVALRDRLLRVPNLPDDSVLEGASEEDNRVIREWGAKPAFPFEPRPHWEIAEKLGIINFEQGSKVMGSGFVVYAGAGARLQRTLINFMLDLHTSRHGYHEVYPPFIVNRDTMTGTGQYPKFVETDGAYKMEGEESYLIPTAEVPVTNLRRDEILGDQDLPLNYVAYTPCFRREAGAAGRETRGITRIHQFDKVELVKLVRPEDSFKELDILLAQAEAVLQALNLHYRVVEICTADLGFSNAKQYDLEVWAPGMGRYLEVSSCSNFTDYQARRANIRFRRDSKAKPEFVHTLNGSGLALPRTVIAILESGQQADGTVLIPGALQTTFGRDRL